MGYSGGKLTPWFDRGPTHRAIEAMVEKGTDRLHELTVANTPVGDTGVLKASWKKKPTVIVLDHLGRVVYESGVETDVDYAPHVEWGTGLWGPHHAKYLIEPKNPDGWLHWIAPDGTDVFAKRVWHPGSPGQHMVAISVGAVEAELDQLVQPILSRWALETERQNHTGLPPGAARL